MMSNQQCNCLKLANGELLMCQQHINELNWWRKRFMEQRNASWDEARRLRDVIEQIKETMKHYELVADAIEKKDE